MDTAHIEKYAVVMKEIKLRKEVIDLFLSGERDAHYEPTTTETLGLQFRKIFELIVFASLAALRVRDLLRISVHAARWKVCILLVS